MKIQKSDQYKISLEEGKSDLDSKVLFVLDENCGVKFKK